MDRTINRTTDRTVDRAKSLIALAAFFADWAGGGWATIVYAACDEREWRARGPR